MLLGFLVDDIDGMPTENALTTVGRQEIIANAIGSDFMLLLPSEMSAATLATILPCCCCWLRIGEWRRRAIYAGPMESGRVVVVWRWQRKDSYVRHLAGLPGWRNPSVCHTYVERCTYGMIILKKSFNWDSFRQLKLLTYSP